MSRLLSAVPDLLDLGIANLVLFFSEKKCELNDHRLKVGGRLVSMGSV